jgi:uncharacterized protein
MTSIASRIREELMIGMSLARAALVSVLAVVFALAAAWIALIVLRPGPEPRITIATGGAFGAYDELAETYKDELARFGVELELREPTEGFATLKSLVEGNGEVDAGFVKGGLVGSLQGRLASAKARDWHDNKLKDLRSVGRMFYEPLWVFTRGDLPIETLRDLEGRKIMVGTRQSGTRRVVTQLLKANGIDAKDSTFIEEELPTHAHPLLSGEVDAAMLMLPADSDKIQQLLRVENIRLMDFSPEAEAYVNRFPALSKVVLRLGSVEFNPPIPSADITLLATTPALVIRGDLHPALVSLLAHTVLSRPRSGFDRNGDPVLFYKAGEFPSASDPEFELASEARFVYKSGELPLLLRVLGPINHKLGLPFSLTAFANAHGAQTLLLIIPMLTIVFPLMKLVPILYTWSIRRRLLYWYHQLKLLERSLDHARAPEEIAAQRGKIEHIDAAVRRIRVPLNFSDQFYDLRGHIDLVRQRLSPQAAVMRLAAE